MGTTKIWTGEKADKAKEIIIDGLANGKSLMTILKESKETPVRMTVYNWLNKNHDDFDTNFLDNYVRAREDSADLDAEKIEEITDKVLTGEYNPAAARVAMDGRKWTAGKKQPKKYGDKLDLTTGGDKLNTPPPIFPDIE